MKIFISNNAVSLSEVLSSFAKTATVEAEFGAECVDGTVATLAHHGQRSSAPCPCLGDNIDGGMGGESVDAIGVSHFDLDTIGGVMRILGLKNFDEEEGESLFWRAVAFIDVNGVHKIGEFRMKEWRRACCHLTLAEMDNADYFFGCEWEDAMDSLNAFWAWSESNRLFAPCDGSVQDVSAFFLEAIRVLALIVEGNTLNEEYVALNEAGRAWAKAKHDLESESYVGEFGCIVLRDSEAFVNHLYDSHVNMNIKAVVALNSKTGAITVSLADPIPGVSCCFIMQELFGPLAGGHAGIAGTPRGEVYDRNSARGVMYHLAAVLATLSN